MASISTRINKNGTIAYVVRAYVCRDAKGTPRYLSKTYTPQPGTSERKVQKTLRELCLQLEDKAQNRYALDSGQKFSDYGRHFLERKARSCSEYTLHSYKIALDKACEYIGHVPLEKLNARHLDEMFHQMNRTRSQYGEPYSVAYIRHIQTIVRMVLGLAVKEGLLTVNAADSDHYTLPRPDSAEPDFLELEEAQQYIRAALEEKDSKLCAMVMLYLFTGIRMEELCGLEWRDVDFDHCRIHIRRASVYVSGQGVITKTPKTRSGIRVIAADPLVFDALQEYREEKIQKFEQAGMIWQESNRLFTKRSGEPVIPGTTAIWLKRFCKTHDLRPVTPHKLRHTDATLQIAYGTDIRTVAGAMGHSSPMTTLTIYAHQVKEASEKASRAMSDMLVPKD